MGTQSRGVSVARRLVQALDDQQRDALRSWASHLLEIRASPMARVDRARAAINATLTREKVVPIVAAMAKGIKKQLWTRRSWSARLGLGAAAAAAATFGGQGAGIAALGGAIGVPLWIVLGAGGSFAGVIIDEIERSTGGAQQTPAEGVGTSVELIPEAEWAFVDDAADAIVNALRLPPASDAAIDG